MNAGSGFLDEESPEEKLEITQRNRINSTTPYNHDNL
jgi:hypothetical protein